MMSLSSKVGPVPVVGLGVYKSPVGTVTYEAVLSALKLGYRHIDTAAVYGNEADVGKAILDSGIPREEIFLTTKIWTMTTTNVDGYKEAIDGVNTALKKLKLEYIDLILLHSPHGDRLSRYRGLEQCLKEGKVRYIGVSNFGINHLNELLAVCTVPPLVNQIEVHAFLARKELCKFCQDHKIIVEAYSPLAKATDMTNETLVKISKKYKKTVAQVMLRYLVQHGYVILPKSEKPSRQQENGDIFDFELDAEDMKEIEKLDSGKTTGWDPIATVE